MGEHQDGQDDDGGWRWGESHGVGVGPRRKEEAPTKSRALEGESDDHHDVLEAASQRGFFIILFYAFMACSHIRVAGRLFSAITRNPPPSARWQNGVCVCSQLWKLCSVRSGYHNAVLSLVDLCLEGMPGFLSAVQRGHRTLVNGSALRVTGDEMR